MNQIPTAPLRRASKMESVPPSGGPSSARGGASTTSAKAPPISMPSRQVNCSSSRRLAVFASKDQAQKSEEQSKIWPFLKVLAALMRTYASFTARQSCRLVSFSESKKGSNQFGHHKTIIDAKGPPSRDPSRSLDQHKQERELRDSQIPTVEVLSVVDKDIEDYKYLPHSLDRVRIPSPGLSSPFPSFPFPPSAIGWPNSS